MTKKTKSRLFVDCQVFQHNTWHRGMGRYTLKLLEAIDKESIELIIILNKNIGIDKSRLDAITQACPSATIRYVRLSEDPNKHEGWKGLQAVCSAELDQQLGSILQPDDTYLIASHFSIRYCSSFPTIPCKKALIFYDLTPYLQWSDYKLTPDFEPKKYFAQFQTIFMADQLWSISESAAEEVKYCLGIDARKVANIRGASIRNTQEKIIRPTSVPLHTKFLLCPSADGPNKNNENMVMAFAEFNARVNHKYKLVITSDFSEQSKDMLSSISPDLIFSGHVSDGELGWLYEHCDALLFVSKTEGLGLPILEAVGADKKVICSDIRVFNEISENAFYVANPLHIQSIADAMDKALLQGKGWEAKKKEYSHISQTFSWPAVAKTCLELTNQPLVTPNDTPGDGVVWYADSDHASLSRDVAEITYALYPQISYRAMRPVAYAYNFPSYLIDMGVAMHALEASSPSSQKNIYLVDDSPEGGQLILRALKQPGLVIALFPKSKVPKHVQKYLKDTLDGLITYRKCMQLLELAGNRITYEYAFSVRGSESFVQEVTKLDEAYIEGAKT